MPTVFKRGTQRIIIAEAKRSILEALPLEPAADIYATLDEHGNIDFDGPIHVTEVKDSNIHATFMDGDFPSTLQSIGATPRHKYRPGFTDYQGTSVDDLNYSISHEEFVRLAEIFDVQVVIGEAPEQSKQPQAAPERETASNGRDEQEISAAYHETGINGAAIRWRYWVEQMPQLSAGEAARLMSALDPDVFKELSNRPNRNDPTELCTKAEMIQRLAERQGLQNASPSDWLEWAQHQEIKVHDGFRMKVESLGVGNSGRIEFTSFEAGVSTSDGPSPLTTSDIAHSFDGLRWSEKEWRKPLGDKPKWLAACVAIRGERGVRETRWNPVLIGAALVQQGHVKARSVRAKFQTVALLRPWLDVWKTYEADNFESD